MQEMSSPEELAILIRNLINTIQNFSDDGAHSYNRSILDYVEKTPSDAVTIEHWRCLLPLSATLTTLHQSFKRAVDSSADQRQERITKERITLHFAVLYDYAYFCGKFIYDLDLFDERWERGELYRLFSPMAFVMDFCTHPEGLPAQMDANATSGQKVAISAPGILHYQMEFSIIDSSIYQVIITLIQALFSFNALITIAISNDQQRQELQLLNSSVMKDEKIAESAMVLCQAMGASVVGGFPPVNVDIWHRFWGLWHHFLNGPGLYDMSLSCAEVMLLQKPSYVVHMLLGSLQMLESHIRKEECARNIVDYSTSPMPLKDCFQFCSLWAAQLCSTIRAEYESQPDSPFESRAVINELSSVKIFQRLEAGVGMCEEYLAAEKARNSEGLALRTLARSLSVSLSLLKTNIHAFSVDGPLHTSPLLPVLDDFTAVTTLWVSLCQEAFKLSKKESIPRAIQINGLHMLAELLIATFMTVEYLAGFYNPEEDNEGTVLLPAFKAIECLSAAHGVLSQLLTTFGVDQEPLLLLVAPILQAIETINILSTMVVCFFVKFCLAYEELSILRGAARAAEAVCKATLLAFKVSQDHFDSLFYRYSWEDDICLDTAATRPIFLFMELLHLTLINALCCQFLDPQKINLQEEYDETITALLLQSLKVLASVPEERLQVFEAVMKKPQCGALSQLVPWADACDRLRKVAIGPEQGLERLLALMTLKVEVINDDEDLQAMVSPFTELIAEMNASAGDNDNESALRKRAAVLSRLQCANLGCTTILSMG